jgi:membrane-bound lytic murein transglycosylase D
VDKGARRLRFSGAIKPLPGLCGAGIVCAGLLFFAVGCASTRHAASTLVSAKVSPPAAVATAASVAARGPGAADTAPPKVLAPADRDAQDSVYGDAADLVDEAKSYIDDSDFASADSTFRVAVKAIESGEKPSDSAAGPSGLIDEIVALYKERMPASYKVPEDIGLAVFQRQMMRSIDSLNVTLPDSVALAALLCRNNTLYDVPVVWNQRVQRALYFYLKNRDNTIDRWFPRAVHYLPAMRAMFADSGLPQDLSYLPLIESGFNPLAYSYANASGIWQFIASTGKTYGLKRNFWIDERRDPIRSTQAAVMYLKKLFGDFGHWHLALAAYNCGENGLARSIARSNSHDFWTLKRLPNQTKNYVPFYLAALTIAKSPKCFGVSIPDSGAPPADTVRMNDCISLSDIASGLGINPDTLKTMNPHIMRWCTPPDVSNTLLYLPSGAKQAWPSFYSRLPPEKRVKWTRYQIKKGDTPESLAQQYNVSENALQSINRLPQSRLTVGHYLFVPVSDVPLGPDVVYTLPPEPEIKALDLPDYEFSGVTVRHRIRVGDNLGRIAHRYHVSVNQLCRWNRITGRTVLRPGRVLVVSRPQPRIETASAPAPVPAAPVAMHAALVKDTAPTVAAPVVESSVPDTVAAGKIASAPVVSSAKTHTVRIGETAFSLSRQYNLSLKELASYNGLDMAHPAIKIGQVLRVSGGAGPPVDSGAAVSPATLTP